MPMAVAPVGMCAHCRADPAADHVPARALLCAIAACSAAMIVAPAPAQMATLFWSRAEYFSSPASRLSGVAPKTDPRLQDLLMVKRGQRVELELLNHSIMPHPMHLHGHAFQVIAINGRPLRGGVRDTVLVEPMMGGVRIAFDAGNPGRWAFHCHNLYHMMTGMMTELRYSGIAV
jgi:FtsP/CotA-like multicopper oxidase with cupredoxin domain